MSRLNASQLYESLQPLSQYYDKSSNLTREEYFQKLAISQTLYLGNLSIFTSEEQIFELFNRIGGGVKKLIMGRNKDTGKPIGFCFLEYYTHEDAKQAQEYLNLLKLDERAIRVDWDIGFSEGREFGRGQGGNQVRDSYRKGNDPERPNAPRAVTFNKQRYRKKNVFKLSNQDGDESDHSDDERRHRRGGRGGRRY